MAIQYIWLSGLRPTPTWDPNEGYQNEIDLVLLTFEVKILICFINGTHFECVQISFIKSSQGFCLYSLFSLEIIFSIPCIAKKSWDIEVVALTSNQHSDTVCHEKCSVPSECSFT